MPLRGKKWVTTAFIMQAAPTPDSKLSDLLPTIRLGLTASKKVGNAVMRNRARRRLRAIAAELLPTNAKPAYDFVLIARPATLTHDHAAMKKDLLWSLKKLEVLNDATSSPT